MSNEESTPQDPESNVEPKSKPQAGEESGNDKEIAKLRKEAAKYRTERNELKKQLGEIAPIVEEFKAKKEADMSEAERLKAQLSELTQAKEAAENEAKRAKLQAMGIPESAVQLIDVNTLNWDDGEALKAQVSPLITPTGPQASTPGPGGNNSNPPVTMETLKGMSRDDITNNMDAVRALLAPKRNNARL